MTQSDFEPELRSRLVSDPRVSFAMAAALMGVWEWDLKSDALTWSATTATAFGLKPEQAPPTWRAFFALVHSDDRQALQEATDTAVRERTDLAGEFRTTSSDGGVRWIQLRGRVAADRDGQPIRILGVLIDVSHRKSLEEQLQQARLEVDRLHVLKATMRTVQDIVGNALTSLQSFRLDVEHCAPPRALQEFDQTIFDTAAKLRALGDLDRVAETEMAVGTGIDFHSSADDE